jgi:hypothetical protein
VAAQPVDVTLALPHEVLMCSGEELDRVGELRVTRDLTVVVAIGAHDVGKYLGVTGVGFGP